MQISIKSDIRAIDLYKNLNKEEKNKIRQNIYDIYLFFYDFFKKKKDLKFLVLTLVFQKSLSEKKNFLKVGFK